MKTWPKRLTITVTAEDVAHGKRGDCETCPVALALTRRLGRSVYVSVAPTRATIRTEGLPATHYWHPSPLVAAINEFDWDGEPIPLGNYRLTREDAR